MSDAVVVTESEQPTVVASDVPPAVVVAQVTSGTVVVASDAERGSVVVTEPDNPVVVVVQDAPAVVVTETGSSEVIVTGVQGPPGPPGPIGPAGGAAFTAPAGETLSGHRAVRISAGAAWHCDADNPAHAGTAVGVTTGAALPGATVTVQSLGNLTELSWSWIEAPVYVGSSGLLTQVPAGVFLQQIGVAVSATEININPQLAVLRG